MKPVIVIVGINTGIDKFQPTVLIILALPRREAETVEMDCPFEHCFKFNG